MTVDDITTHRLDEDRAELTKEFFLSPILKIWSRAHLARRPCNPPELIPGGYGLRDCRGGCARALGVRTYEESGCPRQPQNSA